MARNKIKIVGNICEMILRNREGFVTGIAIFDVDQIDCISDKLWRVNDQSSVNPFVVSNYGRKERGGLLFLHRYIMNTPHDLECDHIDGDRLNNKKSNLRNCTRFENQRNVGLQKSNTSGFKGVGLHRASGLWRAYITISNKHKSLGYFDDKIDAAKAYNDAAKNYFGEFAKLNEIPIRS